MSEWNKTFTLKQIKQSEDRKKAFLYVIKFHYDRGMGKK